MTQTALCKTNIYAAVFAICVAVTHGVNPKGNSNHGLKGLALGHTVPVVGHSLEPDSPPGNSATQGQENYLKQMCRKMCSNGGVCPPECAEVYFDPWVMDTIPEHVQKRASNGLDGFTFDDYLFLRWLGRDVARRSGQNGR